MAEIEAESVAHIVCQRAGLRTQSAEYLSSFVEDNEELDAISLDLISRVAGRLEDMAAACCRRERSPPRRYSPLEAYFRRPDSCGADANGNFTHQNRKGVLNNSYKMIIALHY